jgi:hypothetical protein
MSLYTRPNSTDRISMAFHILTIALFGFFAAAALLQVAVQLA